jgi:KDO2-lipid IV(A) lauroyltransferase
MTEKPEPQAGSDVEPAPSSTAGWSPTSVGFRRWAFLGARHGPRAFVRLSPPLIGLIFGLALPAARRRVLSNLRRIFGRRDELTEAWDVARTFAQFAACLGESLGAGRDEGQRARYRVRGAERFRELREHGKGLIIATAHVGPWDAAARALGTSRQERVMLVMGGEPDARAETFHDLVRASGGLEVVRVGNHPLDALPLLTWLSEGNVAAIQVDRAPRGMDTLRGKLFGADFAVPRGLFTLSSLLGVPVLPVFASREGFFDYRVDVGFPVVVPPGASAEEYEQAAGFVLRQMETFLRAHPTQWFHFEAEAEEPGDEDPED